MPLSDGEFLDLPVNGGDRGTWTLDGKVADKLDQVVRQLQPAPIGARDAREADDLAPVSPDGFKRLQKPVRDARAANAF